MGLLPMIQFRPKSIGHWNLDTQADPRNPPAINSRVEVLLKKTSIPIPVCLSLLGATNALWQKGNYNING